MVKRVGQYQLENKIGEGNFGSVYVGYNVDTNVKIAAKSVTVKSLNGKLLKQMDREIEVLKKLESPHIVKLYDVLKSQRNIYLIMEYCGGGDLDKRVNSETKVEESLAKKWLGQLVDAFICLQEHSVIHRDIKLANILLTEDDDVKVADFGFARFLNENSLAMTKLGTPLFMAPEVMNDDNYSYKADVWSLGVLSYQILAKQPVFNCRSMAELKILQTKEIAFPDISISENAKHFVRSMLVYNHIQRPGFSDLRNHPFLHGHFTHKPEHPVQKATMDHDEGQIKRVESINVPNDFQLSHAEHILTLHHTLVDHGNKRGAFCLVYYAKKVLNSVFKSMSDSTDTGSGEIYERVQINMINADSILENLGNDLHLPREIEHENIKELVKSLVQYIEERDIRVHTKERSDLIKVANSLTNESLN